MSDRPTPAEAARALQDVDQRKGQAVTSVREHRWVAVLSGSAIFVCLAAPDFFGPGATRWTTPVLALLAVSYAVLLKTRRGSAVLGRPARLRREEIAPRFALTARVVVLLVMAAGIALAFFPLPHLSFPYWRTAAGVLLGGFLIVFGRRAEQALLSFARRDTAVGDGGGKGVGNGMGTPHGSR